VDIEEHCVRETKRVVSLLPKKKGQASLLPSLARAEHVRNVVSSAATAAAHVKASGRSAFIIRVHFTHTFALRLDQEQGARL
jgi:hypothetical protein